MTKIEYSRAADATTLCKACGLCCTGHLFSWVRLKASELAPLGKLGLPVIRNDPRQRGFTQPCPMWNGACTVYDHPDYPRGCDSYKCKLLRELLDESIPLEDALKVVEKAKEQIQDMEKQLPTSTHASFRERFVSQVTSLRGMDGQGYNKKFMKQADRLLSVIENSFGVKDFFEKPAQEE